MLSDQDRAELARYLEHPGHRFRKDNPDCERSRVPYWLLSTAGEVVPVRCAAPNRCDPCAKRRGRENAEMIGLDALEHPDRAPEVWLVLTTRTPTLDMRSFYKARELTVRALKRRWGGVSYASVLEYTTGYGPRSGGERRPHWNLLMKGLTEAEIPAARRTVREVWCRHVDARPKQQYVGPVWEVGGLAGYLAAHIQKESQKPPPGFRGQRFNCGRDYFEDCTRAQMRERAGESIFRKSLLWRAKELLGLDDQAAAGAWARDQEELLRSIDWRLIRMGPGWLEEVPPRRPTSELSTAAGRAGAWQTEHEIAAALRARDEHEGEGPTL